MVITMDAAHKAEEIVDEFAFFDDWEERYQHLIDLGRKLPPLDPAYDRRKPACGLSVGGAFQG